MHGETNYILVATDQTLRKKRFYLVRIDLLKVLNDGDDPIRDLRFVEEGAPNVLREETASYRAEGEHVTRVSRHGLNAHPQPQVI